MPLYSTQISVEIESQSENIIELWCWDFVTEAKSQEEAAETFLTHAKEGIFPDQYDMSSETKDSYKFWVGGVTYEYTLDEPMETTEEAFKGMLYDQCEI